MTDDSTRETESRFPHVCNTVVSDVAAVVGKEPEELQTPLYEVVDPEALERLFRRPDGTHRSTAGRVEFEYLGCHVTVRSNGRVHVAPLEEAREAPSSVSDDGLPDRGENIPNR